MYEVLTVVLIAVLALAATAAIYIGLIGLVGGLYFVECSQCGHLTFSASNRPGHSCAHWRHPVLMHPVRAVLHTRHARIGPR